LAKRRTAVAIAIIAAAAFACGCGKGNEEAPAEPTRTPVAFVLSSQAFATGGSIPARYTCDGEDISPPLSWSSAPAGTVSYGLVVDDPDAPGGTFTHWLLVNLPTGSQALPEGLASAERLESGAVQGKNDFGKIGYGGPCPPQGKAHRYRFTAYALDTTLDLRPGASKKQALEAMEEHVLGKTVLEGTYQRRAE